MKTRKHSSANGKYLPDEQFGNLAENAQIYAEFIIDEKGEAHFICHTKDDDFLKTKEAFQKFISILQKQLNKEKECPFYHNRGDSLDEWGDYITGQLCISNPEQRAWLKRQLELIVEGQDAAQTLRKALRDDDDLRLTYKANIAMSFYDQMKPRLSNSQPISETELHQIAYEAAVKSLNLWLSESEEK